MYVRIRIIFVVLTLYYYYCCVVVSGSRDATLRVWDIQTGECKKTLQGHFSAVRWYVFTHVVAQKRLVLKNDKFAKSIILLAGCQLHIGLLYQTLIKLMVS